MTGRFRRDDTGLGTRLKIRSRRCPAGSIPGMRRVSEVSGGFPDLGRSDSNTLEEYEVHSCRMSLSNPDFQGFRRFPAVCFRQTSEISWRPWSKSFDRSGMYGDGLRR